MERLCAVCKRQMFYHDIDESWYCESNMCGYSEKETFIEKIVQIENDLKQILLRVRKLRERGHND